MKCQTLFSAINFCDKYEKNIRILLSDNLAYRVIKAKDVKKKKRKKKVKPTYNYSKRINPTCI